MILRLLLNLLRFLNLFDKQKKPKTILMFWLNKTFLLLFLFFITNFAIADTIYFKDGGLAKGKVVEEGDKKIKIKFQNTEGYIEVYKETIQSIEKESEQAQETNQQLQALEPNIQQKENNTAPAPNISLENINSAKNYEELQEPKPKTVEQKTEPFVKNNINIQQNSYKFENMQKLWLICALSIILVTFLILSPKMIYKFKIYNRSRSDYLQARGTYHLQQIKIPLRKLKERINKLKSEESQLIAQIKNLREERSAKLLEALTRFVVQNQFTNVKGIGPTLRARILAHCFDGTLQSLKRANAVRGIGGEKYYAICQWVKEVEYRLPDLLKDDFPNKNSIIEEYNQLGLSLNINLKNTRKEISESMELWISSLKAKDSLGKVKIVHFIKSYHFNKEASKIVNVYLQGIFPEWGKMPQWFKTLVSEYGS